MKLWHYTYIDDHVGGYDKGLWFGSLLDACEYWEGFYNLKDINIDDMTDDEFASRKEELARLWAKQVNGEDADYLTLCCIREREIPNSISEMLELLNELERRIDQAMDR